MQNATTPAAATQYSISMHMPLATKSDTISVNSIEAELFDAIAQAINAVVDKYEDKGVLDEDGSYSMFIVDENNNAVY